ncbi:MAG TPA: peptidase dimerization domain-containing protein, partial [Longimicrobiales bacterium]|nr:peptidase dimerization domain-containing protein [Longimicrobiales bacterium]
FFEGEEEAGSTHLEEYLVEYRERLDEIDLWLFFDGPVHQSGRPLLTFGVRGVTGMDLTVYGPARSLHSGHYGNWAPVPGQMLADLLASMKDADTGEVLVEGFYDTVVPLGDEERAALDALPSYDDELRRELGLARTEGAPQTLAERLLLPSLTVRGLRSGNVGDLARNVIPATAEAALGIRLVEGNEPDHMLDLVEAHIRARGFHIVREDPDLETRVTHPKVVKVSRGGGYPASRTAMDAPGVADVIAAARAAATSDALPPGSRELVLVPALGGSLPLYLFTDLLDRPAVIVPVANHDNNQHAPDENVRVANLWYAMELYAALLTMPPPGVS